MSLVFFAKIQAQLNMLRMIIAKLLQRSFYFEKSVISLEITFVLCFYHNIKPKKNRKKGLKDDTHKSLFHIRYQAIYRPRTSLFKIYMNPFHSK